MKHFFSIIGGMGTIATESYVRLINHRVKISKDQDYLNYILSMMPRCQIGRPTSRTTASQIFSMRLKKMF